MLTRRLFTLGGLASGAALAAPRAVFAEMTIGNATLTTVSDGFLNLPGSFLFDGMPEAELAAVLKDNQIDPETVTPECNLALYRDGERTVLFDVGSGADFMPNAGAIIDSLDALGLAPEDITDVVFTHAHPDHIWGALDDFDDPLFTEATYHMGQREWDYWWDPDTVNTIGDARAAFAVGAKRRMEAIADQTVLITPETEILPGIQALATYGHTPGHMGFEIAGKALVIGDAIGNHHVALRYPDWASGSDQIAEKAITSRKMLLDRLVREDLAVIGFHLPQGGMGRIDRAGDAFTFVAEV